MWHVDAALRLTTATLSEKVVPVSVRNALLCSRTAVMSGKAALLSEKDAVIQQRTAVLGFRAALLPLMAAALCFMGAVLSFRTAALSFKTAALCFMPAVLRYMRAVLSERTAPLCFKAVPLRLTCALLRFISPSLSLRAMSENEKDPPLPKIGAPVSDMNAPVNDVGAPMNVTGAPLSKSDAPVPHTTPSLPLEDAPESERKLVAKAVAAGTSENVVPLPIKRAAFDKYIVKASTKRLMKLVIRAHVSGKARKGLREELYYRALFEAIEAVNKDKGPKSWETIDGWTTTVTAHAISHYFRKEAVDMKWLNRDAEVEEQPADPPEDLHGDDGWLIKPWLEEAVQDDPADRELFDLLCYTAREEKTFKQVAAERGMTQTALSNRIYRFKLKYIPRWHRHKERNRTIILFVLWGLALAGVVAALVYFLLLPWLEARKPATPPIGPAPVPVLVPAPEPEPSHFNQAAPTDGGSLKPPVGR